MPFDRETSYFSDALFGLPLLTLYRPFSNFIRRRLSSFSWVPPCTKVPTWRLSAFSWALLVPALCSFETCCAIPNAVCLVTVSVSSLKFASVTYAVGRSRYRFVTKLCQLRRLACARIYSRVSGLEKFLLLEFGPFPHILKEEGSAPPAPVSPLLPVCTGVPILCFRAPSQATFFSVK